MFVQKKNELQLKLSNFVDSGIAMRQIERESGISISWLSKFINNKYKSYDLEIMDKLSKYLGME